MLRSVGQPVSPRPQPHSRCGANAKATQCGLCRRVPWPGQGLPPRRPPLTRSSHSRMLLLMLARPGLPIFSRPPLVDRRGLRGCEGQAPTSDCPSTEPSDHPHRIRCPHRSGGASRDPSCPHRTPIQQERKTGHRVVDGKVFHCLRSPHRSSVATSGVVGQHHLSHT